MHDAVYLSTPTSTNESMDTEIATLKAEVIQMESNLHTQGIVSRNLDYGYWSVDWNGLYEGQAAVVYEWCVSHQILHSSLVRTWHSLLLPTCVYIRAPCPLCNTNV